VASQREADRVLRDWASRAGWLPATPAAPPGAAREPASGREADDLRAEVAALKQKLRDLESRLAR
jgi:hypothetical protein